MDALACDARHDKQVPCASLHRDGVYDVSHKDHDEVSGELRQVSPRTHAQAVRSALGWVFRDAIYGAYRDAHRQALRGA